MVEALARVIGGPRYFLQRGESLRCAQSRRLASVVPPTRTSVCSRRASGPVISARVRKSVEERFRIHHEKNITEERLKSLGVSRWSKWQCGPEVTTRWTWEVDEMVYITKGSVEVTPDGCEDSAFFYAGDLVRFPKWFVALLTFDEEYEQCYKFLAYGD